MMHPMRVEWTVPNEAKRSAARERVNAAIERSRTDRSSELYREMLACDPDRRDEMLANRYPDLRAEIVYFGTMLSVQYVAEQWGVRAFDRGGLDLGTTGATGIKLCSAKWVALVVTPDGTVEMDPRNLRVIGPAVDGEPMSGVVSASELAVRSLA